MKIGNIFKTVMAVVTLTTTSCESIENRDILENSFNADDIELQVVQATEGGNKLSIQMNTPGVVGYWDYILDTKYSDRVEVVFPFTGTHTFTYHVTTPYISGDDLSNTTFVEKTVEVNITTLDEVLADEYYALVGDNLEGKTWVFNGAAGDGTVWWAMTDPTNSEGLWWNAGDCCGPSDALGSMTFDLDGGPNYFYQPSPDSDDYTLGSYSLNLTSNKLIFQGAPILGYDEARVNPNSEYDIIELTSEKLTLFTSTNGGGTGWVWVFKPAEL